MPDYLTCDVLVNRIVVQGSLYYSHFALFTPSAKIEGQLEIMIEEPNDKRS
jgi:hypothetical protein